jgi:hypothetical protein
VGKLPDYLTNLNLQDQGDYFPSGTDLFVRPAEETIPAVRAPPAVLLLYRTISLINWRILGPKAQETIE